MSKNSATPVGNLWINTRKLCGFLCGFLTYVYCLCFGYVDNGRLCTALNTKFARLITHSYSVFLYCFAATFPHNTQSLLLYLRKQKKGSF